MSIRRTTPEAAAPEGCGGPADEAKLDDTISRVLVVGLVLGVALLIVGVIVTLVRPAAPALHKAAITDIPHELAHLEPGGFFELGLLLLLATPAARVVALCIGFGRRRRWLFTAFGIIVLAALALSAFLGLRGG